MTAIRSTAVSTAVSASFNGATALPASSGRDTPVQKDLNAFKYSDANPTTPPSLTEEGAKKRFASALRNGIDALMQIYGYGRQRASEELLREIAKGDDSLSLDDEVFKAMESLGVSFADATRAVTISRAFQRARSEKGSTIAAIDDLTSRLGLTKLLMNAEPAVPSSEESHATNKSSAGVVVTGKIAAGVSVEAKDSHAINTHSNKKGVDSADKKVHRTNKVGEKVKHHKSGRKRSFPVSLAASREAKDDISGKEKGVAHEASTDAVEKIVNAKMSMDEKKPSAETSVRAISPTPPVARSKRGGGCHCSEESQDLQQSATKRARVTKDVGSLDI